MIWTGKNVFVTGACGFLGSHLAEALVEAGANVTAMAQYNSMGLYGWLEQSLYANEMRTIHGDIRDGPQMEDLIAGDGGFDVVFHLAALISVPHSRNAVQSYIDTNVTGTMNVLIASRDAGRTVVTSSSEVYGSAQELPINEAHPICPQSPYAASKVAADALAHAFCDTYDRDIVTLRPFNCYGPRQSERAIVAVITRQHLDPACDFIRLGDINPLRDLTYVSDTVDAFMAVANLDNDLGYETFNAGSGKSISIGSLATKISNKPIKHDSQRMRSNEVDHLEADSDRIHRLAGWKAMVPLSRGLTLTKEWWHPQLKLLNGNARYVI